MGGRQKAREWMSIDGLRRKMRQNGDTVKDVMETVGLSESSVEAILKGKASTTTDFMAKMAARYRCGVNELLSFPGIEVKERFSAPFFREFRPRVGEVSYEPLRVLFEDVYGGEWKRKLNEFFDKVEGPNRMSLSREELAARCVRNMVSGFDREMEVHEGLSGALRAKIRSDRPVHLKLVHNMCKVLGCTPDYIMSYR